MAYKAQNQCRMTSETLSTIKNPPVVYAKQANIAHGPQQVNNGPSSATRTGENEKLPNELLEEAMSNPWTPQRREQQALAIHRWKPWERSTGPRSPEGKATSSLNAFKGGHRKTLQEEIRVLRRLLKAWAKVIM